MQRKVWILGTIGLFQIIMAVIIQIDNNGPDGTPCLPPKEPPSEIYILYLPCKWDQHSDSLQRDTSHKFSNCVDKKDLYGKYTEVSKCMVWAEGTISSGKITFR